MPLKTEEITLSGRRYRITQLPAMRAVKLAARIGKIIGPALGAAYDKGGPNAEVSVEAMARGLFDKLSPEDLESVLRDLFATSERLSDDNRAVPVMQVFDIDFAGEGLGELVPFIKFALTVQFGSFGAALLAASSAVKGKAAT